MSDASVAATVVIPTTGDRGPVLELSIASVQRQTVRDLQLLVIGDGLDRDGAATVERLARDDERIEFHDLPKGERRGEARRHQVISEHARGEIVTYLCDRDLYLPRHLEVMAELLADADLAHSLRFRVDMRERLVMTPFPFFGDDGQRRTARARIPLSFAAHRMDAYRRLPHGWRTTPDELATDTYMWRQFLDQPWCRVADSGEPTVLWFKRGAHPGWPTDVRRELMEEWMRRAAEPGFDRRLQIELLASSARALSSADPHRDGGVPTARERLRARVTSAVRLVQHRRRARRAGRAGR